MSINEDPDILPEGDERDESTPETHGLLSEAPLGEESGEVPTAAKVQPVD